MSLAPGARLGPYEIIAPLGAGGMGEVYKAHDTRLERTVAIKILPENLAGDPQFRERFTREARAISQLDHPHICAVYDVGDHHGTTYLVLQYLEGETLADHLTKGALPFDRALRTAIEIAGALDKAHRLGIVHRDLKPGNVMLTKAGAKLLDFGLAKTAAPAIATTGLSMAPTTPPNLTAQGTILGTFQYMAPEQIEGLEADARTDIFAFGALLFEMLTGRTAFEGKTRASLLGAILKDEPPPTSRLQPLASPPLDRIVSTCLAKDPDDRYQSSRDLLRDLQWVASGSSHEPAARLSARQADSTRIPWLVAALATIALIATAVIALRREVAPAASPVQFTIAAPENTSFGGPRAGGTGTATQLAVSPDGRNIVFVAAAQSGYQLWLRPVAVPVATPISGTEGGTFPFWSPDSQFIGFFASGKLKKVHIAGGPPLVLCDAPAGRGGSWSRDNIILFSPAAASGTGLMRVSGAGGVPTVANTLDPATGETNHRWPQFLPDGRHFMYTASTGACCPAAKPSTIKIGSLDPTEATITLFRAESSVSYASSHVLFAHDTTLMAQPFDPEARRLTGDAFPLAERVAMEGSRYMSASVSENGTLVYARGNSPAAQKLTWFDRAGRVLGTLGDAPYIPAFGRHVALSPDETRVAVALETGSPENQDIWIIDSTRNVQSRVTADPGTDRSPVWSPDGTRIAFAGERSGKVSLRYKLINATAADETLLEGLGTILPNDWSRDGRFILYTLSEEFPVKSDVWVLPLLGDRKPFPVLQTAFIEMTPVFSPNGRWIAYSSTEAGRSNIYVQPFPGGGTQYQVSRDGGEQPVWRADGNELFFLSPDGTMMAASIEANDRFDAGSPQALFPALLPSTTSFGAAQYAVTKDGQRFLVIARPDQPSTAPLSVVVNWLATLKK